MRSCVRAVGRPPAHEEEHWLMLALMHSAGLQLMECVRLGMSVVDFDGNGILERWCKGERDRRLLSAKLRYALAERSHQTGLHRVRTS